MENIILIETSGVECSVALCENGKITKECKTNKNNKDITTAEHSKILAGYVEEIIKYSGNNINAVAVNFGPGSYTGLRIGLSLAKGVCYASGAKLIIVDALKPIVDKALGNIGENKLVGNTVLMPMIDARRMEVYTAVYDKYGEQITPIHPLVVEEQSVVKFNGYDKIIILGGNGAKKCVEIFKNNCSCEIEIIDTEYSAADMAKEAIKKYNDNEFADIAYSEPLYIKEWQPQASYYTNKK